MNKYPIFKQNVSKFLINRSYLGNKRDKLLEVLMKFRCVQVDPIDVVARSHELALFNRVQNFRKIDLQKALYVDRSCYEYWLQLFSIIPTEFYPMLSMRRKVVDQWHLNFQKENQLALNQAKKFIYDHGPTSSRDLGHLKGTKSCFSWSNVNSASALLDFLWDRGELVIHHRENNNKYYDFPFRTLGTKDNVVQDQKSKNWILESFFEYSGIVRSNFFNRVGYSKELQLKTLFLENLNNGEITQLEVPGIKSNYYVLTKDIKEMDLTGSEEIVQKVNFLSPLDPLILDRQMMKDFFDFEYLWEAYFPVQKRKFGYYGMPVLYHGKFIGQLDLKKDGSNLKVKNSTLKYPNYESKAEIKAEYKRLEEFVFG